jgi:magnesium transporter
MATSTEKPRRSALYDGGSTISQPRNSNVDRNSKNGAMDYARSGLNGGMTGMGDDLEASTWWLDVLSPTDEEMKMLSQVCFRARHFSRSA